MPPIDKKQLVIGRNMVGFYVIDVIGELFHFTNKPTYLRDMRQTSFGHMRQTTRENIIADYDNDCRLCQVTCYSCLLPSNIGSLSLTEQESIWKNAFSFVAQQTLSSMKSRKKNAE